MPVPVFSAEAARAFIHATPQEVKSEHSRFASSKKDTESASEGPLEGKVKGIGGVIEMLRAKYGCSKGQRLQVIGETNALLQFEGGRTAPKNHEGTGWKWVISSGDANAGQKDEARTPNRRMIRNFRRVELQGAESPDKAQPDAAPAEPTPPAPEPAPPAPEPAPPAPEPPAEPAPPAEAVPDVEMGQPEAQVIDSALERRTVVFADLSWDLGQPSKDKLHIPMSLDPLQEKDKKRRSSSSSHKEKDRAKKSKRRKSSSESSRGKKKDKEREKEKRKKSADSSHARKKEKERKRKPCPELTASGSKGRISPYIPISPSPDLVIAGDQMDIARAARPEGAWWSARLRADLEPLGVGDPGVLCFSALAAWLADSSARAELCSLALSSAVFQSAFNDLWAVREDPSGSGLNSGVSLFSGVEVLGRARLRGPPGEGEETESLLAKEPSEDRSYSSKAKTPSKVWPSARSPLALAMVLATLSFVVWTLPAPTLMGKLDLLRQSWRLNKVLDEAAELRSKLKAAELEKANLEQALVSERARSDSLHERLSASDGTAQSSKTELSNQQDMAGGLRSSNQKLQVDLEKERSARVQLLHELQQLKKAELAELKDPRLDSASILPVTAPSP
ncbi:unnamed protein product [Effrenium voratum]|nr:unnamed protein product [Effrenium voratum]